MKDSIRQVAAECLQTILLDEPWQVWLSEASRYGARIQKLRSAWKVTQRNTATAMLSMLAAYFMVRQIEVT